MASTETVTICSIIMKIGIRAFYYKNNLKLSIIPNNIKVMKDSAFEFCTNLQKIYE